MRKLFFIFLIFFSVSAISQQRPKFLYAEFSDKSVSNYPFYTLFGSNLDPAVTLGGGLDYKHNGNFTFFQTFQITGYATRLIGNGLTLTSSIGYRYGHPSGIFGEALVGVGTSVFYPSRETFSMDENGVFTSEVPVHIMFAAPVDLLLGYRAGKYAFYLKYRYMLTVPYTEANPVMPVSLLGIGIRYNLNVE